MAAEYEQAFNLTLSGTPGSYQRLDFSQTEFNNLILTCILGQVFVFLGDFSGDITSTPHLVVPAGGPSVQYHLPPRGRVITIVNPSTTKQATGCLIALMIKERH